MGAAGLAFLGSLGLAIRAAFADAAVIIHTHPPPRHANVVVVPKPGPDRAVVRSLTEPDCDTTIKNVEGPKKPLSQCRNTAASLV